MSLEYWTDEKLLGVAEEIVLLEVFDYPFLKKHGTAVYIPMGNIREKTQKLLPYLRTLAAETEDEVLMFPVPTGKGLTRYVIIGPQEAARRRYERHTQTATDEA